MSVDLASRNGHHVPGTPYDWRHGYIPLNARVAAKYRHLAAFKRRRGEQVAQRATSKTVLRKLSDRAVVNLYDKHGHRPGVAKALEAEMNRRDRVDRARKRLRSLRSEYEDVAHAQFLAAEAATRGNLLNRKGRMAGVDPQSLFSGPERRAHAYASEELLKFWDRHPRVTVTQYLRGSRHLREAA